MNQRNSYNISRLSVDVNFMIGNVTGDKNGTMISVGVSVKNQENIAHIKKTMSGILGHVLATGKRIVTPVNA